MKFHAMLPVRDEADIIAQSLNHLLLWADAIYVFDTGSVDHTWEIVRDLASTHKRIVPLGKDAVFFSDTRVRGWMFNQARRNMRNGDWFLRVDADEFHHIFPPDFVRTRMRKHETIAWHQYYDFQMTESEAEAWTVGKETLADRQRPIEGRRRWFTPSVYSEPRLCRYRDSMAWPPSVSFPYNSGFVARERLPIRHYPNRDPLQMERRCRLRAIMMADQQNRRNWSQPELHHWAEKEWRKFVISDRAPELVYWKLGDELPEYRFMTHLAPFHKRVVQRFIHALGLPILDRIRPKWTEYTYPLKIAPEVVADLETQLRI
jgi:glycosyltransferase involved in cell wall biosynthesis